MEKADTMRAIAMLDMVRRLLAHEAAEDRGREASLEAAERVLVKLRAHLSRRTGQEGFQTLLARALTLTVTQVPRLSAVQVEADGSLVGLRDSLAPVSSEAPDSEAQEDAIEGAVALIAHLFGLLVTFIGEDLTLRMLGTLWPGLEGDGEADQENGRP